MFLKKSFKASPKEGLALSAIENYKISVRRACSLIMISTSVWYYIPSKRDESVIRKRMREIAEVRVRYGFWRIFTLLRREGFTDNSKRVYRIYKNEGLNLRSKRPRRSRSSAHRLDRIELLGINQSWSMDFVADQLFDGRKFRALTVVDNFSHKCLAIQAGQSLKGTDVVQVMNIVKDQRNAVPVRIQVDNGSEFISKDLDRWAYDHGVVLDYSRPGKPTDNPYIESFNGKFRDECLNVHWFLSLEDAQTKIDLWREEYNSYRPHSSIDDLTPDQFEEVYENKPGTLL
jgi:putative transposase